MWDIEFITKENFKKHISDIVEKYTNNLDSYDLKKFNKNIIDPVKMIFDKNVYNKSWDEIIESEIFRQRDKANNNDIGYFHQKIFEYIKKCEVPKEGWDIIVSDENKIEIEKGLKVSKLYVEMKNKHNTMNSSSSAKLFIKMQNQLLKDDDCACFLVEAIASKSQNIKWETKVDKDNVGHKLIRRVSIDKFYEIVTGDKMAFFKVCQVLPEIIREVLWEKETKIPKDSVIEELKKLVKNEKISMEMAFYLLAFDSYEGFRK